MKYTIKPGIAALVDVHCDEFPERFGERKQSYIFMAEGKPVEKGVGDTVAFSELPIPVQAQINRHFGTVFALPVERRAEYLRNCIPWEVEA